MTATELLVDLIGQGFTLTRIGDAIRIQPASRLSADLRQAILARKRELLRLLDLCEQFVERVAIAHYDGGLSMEQAESLALAELLCRGTAGAEANADLFTIQETAGTIGARA